MTINYSSDKYQRKMLLLVYRKPLGSVHIDLLTIATIAKNGHSAHFLGIAIAKRSM